MGNLKNTNSRIMIETYLLGFLQTYYILGVPCLGSPLKSLESGARGKASAKWH